MCSRSQNIEGRVRSLYTDGNYSSCSLVNFLQWRSSAERCMLEIHESAINKKIVFQELCEKCSLPPPPSIFLQIYQKTYQSGYYSAFWVFELQEKVEVLKDNRFLHK